MGLGIALGMLLGAWMPPALADVVHLKNGDRITGKLDGISGNRLILQTEFAGTLILDTNLVLSVATVESFDLKLRDGDRLSGLFVATPEGQGLLGAEAETRPLKLDQVRMKRSTAIATRTPPCAGR